MKFVLDASVALKTVLKEPDSAAAIALRDDFKNQVHELIAPDTLPIEIAHALTRAERREEYEQALKHGKNVAEILLAGFRKVDAA